MEATPGVRHWIAGPHEVLTDSINGLRQVIMVGRRDPHPNALNVYIDMGRPNARDIDLLVTHDPPPIRLASMRVISLALLIVIIHSYSGDGCPMGTMSKSGLSAM